MNPVILIARPAEDAAETVAAVEAAGFRAICVPVLSIGDCEAVVPDAGLYRGVIFSSANGVRGFVRRGPERAFLALPAFAVGAQTAGVLRESGFADVRVGGGTMADLVAAVREQVTPPGRLLHVRGRDVREDPAALLSAAEGWVVDGITVYVATPVERLPEEAMAALREGRVAAVLLYSARGAAAFMAACSGADLRRSLSGVRALCLADSVVKSLDIQRWGAICVAARPDASGMLDLIKALDIMQTHSADLSTDDNALSNAGAVIERFGGIRPMATKMKIPVTTVQGWKKRNVIPGNRRDDVISAARAHNIDLSGIVANQNDFAAAMDQAGRAPVAPAAPVVNRDQAGVPVTHEDMMREIWKSQTATVRKSVLAATSVLMVFAVVAGLVAAIGKQEIDRADQRITVLEQDRPAAPTVLEDLRGRMGALEDGFKGLKDQAQSMAGAADATMGERLATLEQTVKGLDLNNPNLSALIGKLQSPQALGELQGLVSKLQGRVDTLDQALAQEKDNNTALGKALEGVSPKDLKAAAMLIGLNQLRGALGRSAPFADDLAMLQGMVGDQDPELNAAIAKLAPYADKGVLSPEALSTTLRDMAGEIAVAAVQGQHISVQDRALARLQNLVNIEKDGRPVIGTDAQSTLARAQKLMDAGDVDGAVTELQSLQGPARDKAQPLIDQAQVTMIAQQVQALFSRTIGAQVKGAVNGVPLTAKPGIGGAIAPFKNLNNSAPKME